MTDFQSHATPDPAALPQRGHLMTEQRLVASAAIDAQPIEQALQVINTQDAAVAPAVRKAIPAISALVAAVVERMQRGGRLVYGGAGTSGRLAVLDASECPPTFHCDPSQVVGLIAGGDGALRNSIEGAEDSPEQGAAALRDVGLTADDVFVGIAAGGTTPWVWGALRHAKDVGAVTAMMCCVPLGGLFPLVPGQPQRKPPMEVDHAIELLVGPEVVTGSTRMKAGTATKLALNMITTTTMIQLGKVWGNLMIDLKASNAKLVDRALRIIETQCRMDRDKALELLEQADGRVKLALVMGRRGVDRAEALRLLAASGERLRPVIGEPYA